MIQAHCTAIYIRFVHCISPLFLSTPLSPDERSARIPLFRVSAVPDSKYYAMLAFTRKLHLSTP